MSSNNTEHVAASSSDPIQEYTSPNKLEAEYLAEQSVSTPDALDGQGSDDEEMPDVSALLEADNERRKQLRLNTAKQRALEQAERARQLMDDDDDDLVIEGKDQRLGVKLASTSSAPVLKPSRLDPKLALGSKSNRYLPRVRGHLGKGLHRTTVQNSQKGLFGSLLGRVDAQSQDLRKQKEEEWLSRGGKLKSNASELQVGEETELDRSLKRFLEAGTDATAGQEAGGASDEEDPEDNDWVPENRGSASPMNSPSREEDSEAEQSGPDDQDEGGTEIEEGTNDEAPKTRVPLRISRPSRVVNSDSEDEADDKENAGPGFSRVLVPDTSGIFETQPPARKVSSLLSPRISPVDEEDKENNSRLMYDNDADKENVAVPRHVPLGRPALGDRQGSGLFGLSEGFKRSLSVSSGEDTGIDSDVLRVSNAPVPSDDLDDPFAFPAPLQPSSSRRIQANSLSPQPLQPAFGEDSTSYSQFFGDDPVPINQKLRFAASQASEPPATLSTSQSSPKALDIGGMSQLFSTEEVGI